MGISEDMNTMTRRERAESFRVESMVSLSRTSTLSKFCEWGGELRVSYKGGGNPRGSHVNSWSMLPNPEGRGERGNGFSSP